ncbi:unnamed protein product [Prorocentrum cordatum]|uniref:LamG-like jellyroll fold domain-containing protein n=1 Tax=Prorocentrum cordatum TaxID=2364126 RepID=A0ABN9TQC5_9DINO|nr:unnamed protein product [Polarella glacialis]
MRSIEQAILGSGTRLSSRVVLLVLLLLLSALLLLLQSTGPPAVFRSSGRWHLAIEWACGSADPAASTTVRDCSRRLTAQTSGSVVGHWRFDDAAGTRHWRDDSPFGNALVSHRYSGFQYPFAEVIPDAGLGASGAVRILSRSHARAESVPVFRTISFWAKPDPGTFIRVDRLVGAMVSGEYFFIMWVDLHSSTVRARFTVGGTSVELGASLDLSHHGTDWDHLAVTMSASEASLFINGVSSGEPTQHNLPEPGFDSVAFLLGTGHPHNAFFGVVDELRLYSAALGDSEVMALAAAKSTNGTPEGENLPPRVDAGPALTLWKPAVSGWLEGSCVDQDGAVARAEWQVVRGPDVSAVTIHDASSASTQFDMASDAPVGEYLLRLGCSDGAHARSATTGLLVFVAHEEKVGNTTESLPPGEPFPFKGLPVSPVGLWPLDGSLSSALPGGSDAELVQVRPTAEYAFVEDGRFGGALRLTCPNSCVQLSLGNAEPAGAPWPAMSAALWFKTDKTSKLTLISKGGFSSPLPSGFTPDVWHHYAAAAGPDIRKAYLDGQPISMESGVANRTEQDAASTLTLGIFGGHPSYGFDGLVDDIAVFDFVLSNEEVEVLYTQGAASFTHRGAMNPLWRGAYNRTMVAYFPELPEEPDYAGHADGQHPSQDSPAAYVHPRIFFTPEELPALRRRLRQTTVGRVAMENIRGILRHNWDENYPWWWARNATEEELFQVSPAQDLDQQLILESFRTLIDGDSAMAVRIGQQLDYMADAVQARLDAALADLRSAPWELFKSVTAWDSTNAWQEPGGPLLRYTLVAYCYDFLYPWLQQGTRDKLRRLMATATQNMWFTGMDAVEAYFALTSNWLPWVGGDMIVTMLAIEGEDGFDKGVYARAAKAVKGWSLLGVSAVSGATYEGGGKNTIMGPKLMALARHGYPQFLAMPGIRKHGSKYLLHTMLPNGLWLEDEKWGSVEAVPLPGDVAVLKMCYPTDVALDWIYRTASRASSYGGMAQDFGGGDGAMPYRSFTQERSSVYTYNNYVTDVIYAVDWEGPLNRTEHALAATYGQPLTYVATDTGLLVTRSAWVGEDAAWLAFLVRSLPGGHSTAARGEFIFHAIGETWAFYNTGTNSQSEMHSVILVDGLGQSSNAPGKFVQFQDSAEATFGSMDARLAYGCQHFGGDPSREVMNSFMVEPLPYKWGDLRYDQLPSWFAGNGPWPPQWSGNIANLFTKAYRTVGMVRSQTPYAIVFDDIQKDIGEHVFAWRMPLRDRFYSYQPSLGEHVLNVVDHSYFGADGSGSDFILRDTSGGPGRLLVRLLEGSSPHMSAGIISSPCSALQVETRAVSARFRVLLWPLENASSPLPVTSWVEAISTLKINDDEIVLSVTDDGATMVEALKVDGASVALTTNEIAQTSPPDDASGVQGRADRAYLAVRACLLYGALM